MEHLLETGAIISLLTLTVMEIVLGIDNIVFISIVSGRLPQEQQKKARNWGLILALLPRILLLLSISWLIGLKEPLFQFELLGFHIEMTGKGLILLLGGLFLLYSSTNEIHHKLEGAHEHHEDAQNAKKLSFSKAILQIILLNIIFSFDSVLTAVGLAEHVEIMIFAVIFSSLIMMLFAGYISDFVNKHPTVKMLALSFLLMIGFLLVLEAFEVEVPKGYVYFAMGFSLFVEVLNLRMTARQEKLRKSKQKVEVQTVGSSEQTNH
ncbi:MAG: TerC family protein [Cytophagales bacterium]|nr:MAG: TerC family protein [Cytophagales bacterium]